MVEAGPMVVVEVWDQDIVKDNLTWEASHKSNQAAANINQNAQKNDDNWFTWCILNQLSSVFSSQIFIRIPVKV